MSYPPPPPEQPDYDDRSAYGGQGPGQPSGGRGMAIAALVLGVLALLLCWTVIGGVLLGLLAIVLGIIAAVKAGRGTAQGRGLAITGAVLGAIGLILSGVLIAIGISVFNSESGQNLQDCLEAAGDDQTAVEQCQAEFDEDLQGQFG